jgi:hypothetical protein
MRGWRARRRDGIGGDITANDANGLLNAIREDYDLKPVPRGDVADRGARS